MNGLRPAEAFRTHNRMAVAALLLITLKPIADAVSERSLELRVDFGTIWTAMGLVLFGAWFVGRRRASWETWVLVLAMIGLSFITLVHVILMMDGRPLAEGTRVLAGLAPAAVALSTLRNPGKVRWRRFVVVMLAAVGLHVVSAWLQVVGVLGTTYTQFGEGRPSGLFFHPVSLGYLLVATVLVIGLLHLRNEVSTRFAVLGALTCVATVAISTHRASALVMLLVMSAWAITALLRIRSFRIEWIARTALVAAALAVVLAASTPLWIGGARDVVNGIVGVLNTGDLDPASPDFLRGRGEIWRATTTALVDGGPIRWAIGYGFQTMDPHTDYLRVPFVHGLVGGAILLTALVAWAGMALRQTDRLGRGWVVLGLVAMAVFAITIKPTSYPSFMWAWTFVLWLAVVTRPPRAAVEASPTRGTALRE